MRSRPLIRKLWWSRRRGITNGQQVYDFIMAGSEAAGSASGIMNAEDRFAVMEEMIAAVRRAADDLKKQRQ